jgi:hypothetical protein
MKNKQILIVFILGGILTILGALFKIMHMELGAVDGNLLLTIGMLTQIISLILFIIKLMRNKKDNFLNK